MATATKKASGETCYGCGAQPEEGQEQHPFMAVINKSEAKGASSVIENPDSTRDFVGVPVCLACHKDPAHRSAHDIKGHFFERIGNMPKVALMLAGSPDIGG